MMASSKANVWVLDFDGYMVGSLPLPLEFALFNCATEEYSMFYIKFGCPRADTEGDYEDLDTALKDIIALLGDLATVFIQGGRMKVILLSHWLNPDGSKNRIRVEEVSIKTLDWFHPSIFFKTACERHNLTSHALRCAQHKAFVVSELLTAKQKQQQHPLST